MTLIDHIRELRMRLFIVAIVFIVGSAVAYVLRDCVVHVLLEPLKGQKLVYLSVAGGFNFVFLISIYVGLAFAAPVLIQQLYAFVRPVLPEKIQKYSVRIFISSLLLLSAGIVFGYYCAIPGALNFLYNFADTYVQASLTSDSYLSFIISYTLGLGLVFQLPLVLLFIHWIKPLKPGGLLRSERWVILLAFIAAAFITPTPDPINQTVMALPIVGVYQLGVIAVLISIGKERRRRRSNVTSQSHGAVVPAPIIQSSGKQGLVPVLAASSPVHERSERKVVRKPSMDGFVPAHKPVQTRPVPFVPALPSHTPALNVVVPRRPSRPSRGYVVDGIIPRMTTT